MPWAQLKLYQIAASHSRGGMQETKQIKRNVDTVIKTFSVLREEMSYQNGGLEPICHLNLHNMGNGAVTMHDHTHHPL